MRCLVDDNGLNARIRSNTGRVSRLSLMCELGEAIHHRADLGSILKMILVAVTAGQGLGFNRAFLLLADDECLSLTGKLAIGPSNAEEAGRIWSQLQESNPTLAQLAERYTRSSQGVDVAVNELVRQIRIPLERHNHILVRALRTGKSFNIRRDKHGTLHGLPEGCAAESVMELLGVKAFAVAPILGPNGTYGVILADNMITGAHIHDDQVCLLKTLANHAGIAINNVRYQEELERRVLDLKEVNLALQENKEKLLKSERLTAIGEITSMVAHEVKNPLVVIGGFARMVRDRLPCDDESRQSMDIVISEATRLEKMVAGILEYARPMPPRVKPVDLNSLIEETESRFRGECLEAGIEVLLDLQEDLPRFLLDRDQIYQVLVNICLNAKQAMPDGGRLHVSTGMKDGVVSVQVRDSGSGISPAEQAHMFDPFFTTRPEGSGLGLAIAAEIMRGHGGRIVANSLHGQGMTLILEFPCSGVSEEVIQIGEKNTRG